MANFPTSLPSATPATHGEVVGEVVALATTLTNAGWGTLGYAQVTASQGSITTEVDLTGLTVAVTVGTGRRVRISAKAPAFSTVGSDSFLLFIKEGATYLDTAPVLLSPTSSTTGRALALAFATPTAGSHTYKLAMSRVGSGTVTMNAAAAQPASILVEDIGV